MPAAKKKPAKKQKKKKDGPDLRTAALQKSVKLNGFKDPKHGASRERAATILLQLLGLLREGHIDQLTGPDKQRFTGLKVGIGQALYLLPQDLKDALTWGKKLKMTGEGNTRAESKEKIVELLGHLRAGNDHLVVGGNRTMFSLLKESSELANSLDSEDLKDALKWGEHFRSAPRTRNPGKGPMGGNRRGRRTTDEKVEATKAERARVANDLGIDVEGVVVVEDMNAALEAQDEAQAREFEALSVAAVDEIKGMPTGVHGHQAKESGGAAAATPGPDDMEDGDENEVTFPVLMVGEHDFKHPPYPYNTMDYLKQQDYLASRRRVQVQDFLNTNRIPHCTALMKRTLALMKLVMAAKSQTGRANEYSAESNDLIQLLGMPHEWHSDSVTGLAEGVMVMQFSNEPVSSKRDFMITGGGKDGDFGNGSDAQATASRKKKATVVRGRAYNGLAWRALFFRRGFNAWKEHCVSPGAGWRLSLQCAWMHPAPAGEERKVGDKINKQLPDFQASLVDVAVAAFGAAYVDVVQ